jgi:hypothetical protein
MKPADDGIDEAYYLELNAGPSQEYHDFMDGILDRMSSTKNKKEDQEWRDALNRSREMFKDLSEKLDRLKRVAIENNEVIITASQTLAELDDLLELTPEEKTVADAYEDKIEATLDLLENVGKDVIRVSVFPVGNERIRDYLVDRYKGWDIETDSKSKVWIFRAR